MTEELIVREELLEAEAVIEEEDTTTLVTELKTELPALAEVSDDGPEVVSELEGARVSEDELDIIVIEELPGVTSLVIELRILVEEGNSEVILLLVTSPVAEEVEEARAEVPEGAFPHEAS